MPDRCAVCGGRAVHSHHVVYEQHVRKHGGDPRDRRNLMPLCLGCHGAHHNRSRVIPVRRLSLSNLEFAAGLLGEEYAEDYLARYYGEAT
jgi:hypothetical protein